VFTTPTGRILDRSCPYSGDCWAQQGCLDECPRTLHDVLVESAYLEHELGLTPHTDPDLAWACETDECRTLRGNRT